MPYATYRFNKIIAAETIRFIVTVAIVVYKGLKLVVYRMLTVLLKFQQVFENVEDIRRFLSKSIKDWEFSLNKSETLVDICDFFRDFSKNLPVF